MTNTLKYTKILWLCPSKLKRIHEVKFVKPGERFAKKKLLSDVAGVLQEAGDAYSRART